MSMENAILEHAAALRDLSASIKAMYAGRAEVMALPASQGGLVGDTAKQQMTYNPVDEVNKEVMRDKQQAAELEQAVQKVEADAKGTTRAEAAANQAAIEAERKEAEDNQAGPLGADAPADLDYAKDVRPVLLAAIKKAGKDAVAAMLTTYGVDKADKLKPEQLPAVLAEAQKLAA